MRIGYACINLTTGASSNRGMVKKTFLQDKNLEKCASLALENVKGLREVVKWNNDNGIQVFRMSSCIFPWMSEYEIDKLPGFSDIEKVLKETGEIAISAGQRLSFHPGPFNILASPNEAVIKSTVKELDQHSQILSLLGQPENQMSKINIHVGGAYGDKKSAIKRWIENFKKLDKKTQRRLTIENDDKTGLYSVKDLYEMISSETGTPIVFDYFHHSCHPDGMTEKEALEMALSTWTDGIIPCAHYSSSKKIHEDDTARKVAHADYIYEKIDNYGKEFDIVFEAKAKDLAVLKYKSKI